MENSNASCSFTGTLEVSEETRQALLDLALDSDDFTVCAQYDNGELVELISIKRLERCPKELFKRIISLLQKSLYED